MRQYLCHTSDAGALNCNSGQSFADFQRKGRPCCDSYLPELASISQFQNTGGDR